ncbi:MAG: hypothetical protein EBR30_29160 [Cytophagia bacterium]|nr:hypothetical protein [Cytophagia bacterium]
MHPSWKKAIESPSSGVKLFLQNFADSELSKKLVDIIVDNVISTKLGRYSLSVADVEHDDFEKPEPIVVEALFIEFKCLDDSTATLVAGPSKLPDKSYDFLRLASESECTLIGEYDNSLWVNDEYLFEGASEELLDELSEYEKCVIENGNCQWVVRHNETDVALLVTSKLSKEFNNSLLEDFETTKIEQLSDEEIFLRVMTSIIFQLQVKEMLKSDDAGKSLVEKIKNSNRK